MNNVPRAIDDVLLGEGLPDIGPDTSLAGRALLVLEKYSSMTKALLSVVDQAIVSGTSFVTAVIIGRATSPDLLGQYYLMLTVVLIALGFQENFISGPFTVLRARRRGLRLAVFTGSTWLLFGAMLIGLALLLTGVLAATPHMIADHTIRGLWVMLGIAPLLMLREAIRRFAFADLQMMTAIGIDAAVSALQLTGLALLLYFDRMSILAVFGVMGGACAAASIGWLVLRPPTIRLVPGRVFADWSELWGLGKWAVLSYAIVDTIPFAMPWIVFRAGGLEASGTYGACTTLVGMMNVLVGGAGNFLRPQAAQSFASGGEAALVRVLAVASGFFVGIFGIACVLIWVTGDRLVVLVFGADYAGTGGILLALAASVLVGSLGWIAGNGLWAVGRLRASFVADICMLTATMAAAVGLVGRYGPLGAALATFIGMVVGASLKGLTLRLALLELRANKKGDTTNFHRATASSERSGRLPIKEKENSPTRRLSVSVIIPTYNRAALVVEAIESVLAQTRRADEIIVVDDGSTDDTSRDLSRFGASITLVVQPNRGLSAARNRGIESSCGDILLFLDSDDLLLPNCIERSLQELESDETVDVIYTDCFYIDQFGNRIGIMSKLQPGERPSGMILGELGHRWGLLNISSASVRRRALGGIEFDESVSNRAEDFEFWRQLSVRSRFCFIDEPLACYRFHASQITATCREQVLDGAIEVQRRLMSMPEFARLSRIQRARVYCHHGVKQVDRGNYGLAREFFLRSLLTSPGLLQAAGLFGLSLLGSKLLCFVIARRRQFVTRSLAIATSQANSRPAPCAAPRLSTSLQSLVEEHS